MKEIIEQTLTQLEQQHQIQILYAVESGSRAWGFASPDSDYDVRYIYIRSREDYLGLDQPKDTIEGPLDEVLDFSGWDIRKALVLLRKTNPSLQEWLHSPIVYRNTPAWEKLSASFSPFFSIRKNMYHYLSMVSTDWNKMLTADQVKLKRYLYILRALLCCRWLEQFREAPPIEFDILCAKVLPEELAGSVAEVLRRKLSTEETGLSPHFHDLDAFVCTELARLQVLVPTMPDAEIQDFQILNQLFLQVLEDTQTRKTAI